MQAESRQFHFSYVFCGIVFLGFAIQVLGIALTDKNLHPLIAPTPLPLRFAGNLGLGISLAAPFLSIGAMIKVRSEVKTTPKMGGRVFIWTMVILAILLSFAEALWSCGGHPSWYQGFSG
jgi:uncharacterized membrane protein